MFDIDMPFMIMSLMMGSYKLPKRSEKVKSDRGSLKVRSLPFSKVGQTLVLSDQ